MRNPLDEDPQPHRAAMNAPQFPASTAMAVSDEYICWSRMQSEAGQSLDVIIARKERERLAGGGLFFWGVGNAPATISSVLARAGLPVPVIFSIMKSRPKTIDVSPSRTVVWRRYIDAYGAERELPAHALITSRADSPSGPKRVHYALMCRSSEPLVLKSNPPLFDPTAFRNAGGTGAPVGNSQVTALLKRVKQDAQCSDYEANLEASLAGDYWVRLTDPVEIDYRKADLLRRLQDDGEGDWSEMVSDIRQGSRSKLCDDRAEMLF